jgi:mRNA interferase MazF
MPILYPVKPGTLLLCDYSLGGFREPEMVKRRPAIVVSPRLPHRDNLCAVVPLSSKPGARELDYIVKLQLREQLPAPFELQTVWAKCDMLATVSFARLDLFRTSRDQSGKRRYIQPRLPEADWKRIQQRILFALGLNHFQL